MKGELRLENLLDMNIEESTRIFESNFELDSTKNFYINTDILNRSILGEHYRFITLITDENNRIKNVSIRFEHVISKSFNSKLVLNYGKPDKIFVQANRKSESETIVRSSDGKIVEKLSKNTFDLVEGNFDQNPLFIIWNKENYQIKITRRYRSNISDITFNRLN